MVTFTPSVLTSRKFCPVTLDSISVFSMVLGRNGDYIYISHQMIGFYNWDVVCLLCGTSWIYVINKQRQTQLVYISIYRVFRGECARLRENVPYVKVRRSNPKHLYPKLNGYRDNGERKVWSSCGSTHCTCFPYCYPYTAHVRPSVSQPSQAHSAFIINRCHS